MYQVLYFGFGPYCMKKGQKWVFRIPNQASVPIVLRATKDNNGGKTKRLGAANDGGFIHSKKDLYF